LSRAPQVFSPIGSSRIRSLAPEALFDRMNLSVDVDSTKIQKLSYFLVDRID
jgi:hypothetical protein